MAFQLVSSVLRSNGVIPKEHTCDGADTSVPLAWQDPPEGTKSFALIADDPDAPRGTWVHWVLYDLPPDTRELPSGVRPEASLRSGGRQGKNDFGKVGYGGPCPPAGSPHHYHFKLYALDQITRLQPKATKQQLLDAMNGHVLAETELVGIYKR